MTTIWLETIGRAGIDLHTRHAGPAIVHDDQSEIDFVLNSVDESGDAAVEKCRVAIIFNVSRKRGRKKQ